MKKATKTKVTKTSKAAEKLAYQKALKADAAKQLRNARLVIDGKMKGFVLVSTPCDKKEHKGNKRHNHISVFSHKFTYDEVTGIILMLAEKTNPGLALAAALLSK